MSNCFPKWLHHFTFPPVIYEGSSFSTFSPALTICLFFFIAILVVVEQYLIVAFIWISLSANDVGLFSCVYWSFVYLLWRNVYSDSVPIFQIRLCVSLLLNYKSSIYILNSNSLSDIEFASIFFHFVGCLLSFLMVFLEAQGILI